MSVKSKQINFSIVDPRTVRVFGNTKNIKRHKNKTKNEITSLELPDSRLFSVGDVMTIRNHPYKINIITKSYFNENLVYDLHTAKKTKALLMILPMLSGGKKDLFFYDTLLVNCFIGTKERGKGKIILLYRWSNSPLFVKFEKALKQFRSFVLSADISEHFSLYEFNVPSKSKKDYNKFINGEYSKFSNDYKSKVLKFHDADINSQLAQILYKGDKRKLRIENDLGVTLEPEAELMSIIDENEELFDINYYL